LGKAIQYGYLDEAGVDPPKVAQRAQEIYRELKPLKPNRDPYHVINRLRREGHSMEALEVVNSYFLSGRRQDFTFKTARVFMEVLTWPVSRHYGRPDGLRRNPTVLWMSQSINRLHALNAGALVFAFGFSVHLFVNKRKEQFIALMMMLSVVVYHLATVAAFGYSEYPRLRVPVDPLLNLLVLLPVLLFLLYFGERLKIRSTRAVAPQAKLSS
jgi:hypothetical protein